MMIILSSQCSMGLIVSTFNSIDIGTITRRKAPNTPTRLIIVGLALIAETTREMKFRNTPEEYMAHTMNLNKTHILIDEIKTISKLN